MKQLTYRVVVTVPEDGEDGGPRSLVDVRQVVEDSLESLVGALEGMTVTYKSLGWAFGLPEGSDR